jgi:hypothetical protein
MLCWYACGWVAVAMYCKRNEELEFWLWVVS